MPDAFYHGTDHVTAQRVSSRTSAIDVARGGGEFGRGFYVGDSPVLALQFAIGRFGVTNARALRFIITQESYSALETKYLAEKDAKKLRQRVRRARATRSHLVGVDVVCGPIEGRAQNLQSKFETERSQAVLNDPACTTIELVR
ncbi:hypothetical protein [Polyangium mundeleinium]|uniref:DUF3990 domain-containing protein n=1 Tax=Polyangium mundeleinium TaxID=2995306 RepID=A0ABT5EGE5_9BACT|nr:hypothetical protein [Polyangium mundeleinium]MDC0740885.1 hypothetical protein [Polyangium mundeleinium]